jgi:hypothetical protein
VAERKKSAPLAGLEEIAMGNPKSEARNPKKIRMSKIQNKKMMNGYSSSPLHSNNRMLLHISTNSVLNI